MRSDFVAVILTHGRAASVLTINALKKSGYTGDIIVLIDNEDDQAPLYCEKYGDSVRVFDKNKYVASSQTMCPASDVKRGVIFANIIDLDSVFGAMVRFLERAGVSTIALAQGGDMIGGKNNPIFAKGVRWKRKAMNSFVFSVDCPLRFSGAVNEDVVTYVLEGMRGDVLLTTTRFMLNQRETQRAKGGMTEEYLDDGTFCKSMFAVVARPDCVRLAKMGGET